MVTAMRPHLVVRLSTGMQTRPPRVGASCYHLGTN